MVDANGNTHKRARPCSAQHARIVVPLPTCEIKKRAIYEILRDNVFSRNCRIQQTLPSAPAALCFITCRGCASNSLRAPDHETHWSSSWPSRIARNSERTYVLARCSTRPLPHAPQIRSWERTNINILIQAKTACEPMQHPSASFCNEGPTMLSRRQQTAQVSRMYSV